MIRSIRFPLFNSVGLSPPILVLFMFCYADALLTVYTDGIRLSTWFPTITYKYLYGSLQLFVCIAVLLCNVCIYVMYCMVTAPLKVSIDNTHHVNQHIFIYRSIIYNLPLLTSTISNTVKQPIELPYIKWTSLRGNFRLLLLQPMSSEIKTKNSAIIILLIINMTYLLIDKWFIESMLAECI